MNVWLKEDGEVMRGDLLVRWVLRTDLAPIPRTVELTVRIKDGIEDRIKEGESFWTGREKLKYRIIKTDRPQPAGVVQGNDSLSVLTAIAVLEPLHRVTFVRDRAVIREHATFAEIYRACGSAIAFGDDLRVERFSSFIGQVPTFNIAQALQEECACVVLRNKKLSFIRLPDLFKQEPKTELGQTDSTALTKSVFLERHEIPAYYSVTDSGAVIHGDLATDTRTAQFIPHTSQRILRNLSRVLVTRRMVPSSLAEDIAAGDIITIGGKKQAVITAAHVFEQHEGMTSTYSRFWTGELNK